MKIIRKICRVIFLISLILTNLLIIKAQSLTDIYDLGVNLGQMEAFSIKDKERDYVAQTALPRAKQHALRINVFQSADVIAKFDALSREYVEKGLIAHSSIEATRIHFENRLRSIVKNYNLFDLGVNLGQMEAFAQLKQKDGIDFIDKFALPRAKQHASSSGVLQRIENIFQTLAPASRTEENFERKILAARLLFHEQLEQLSGNTNIFRAGAYKIELHTQINECLVGFDERRATGKKDSLFVRALVLDDGKNHKIALASVDALLLYKPNLDEVKSQVIRLTGISNVLLVATHSHSVPEFSTGPPNGWNCLNFQVNRAIRMEQIVSAIVTAAGSLQPSEIGSGWGNINQGFNRVERFIENGIKKTKPYIEGQPYPFERCNLYNNVAAQEDFLSSHFLDPIDNEVGVIRIRNSLNKTTIATLINYAMHGVIWGYNNKSISPDYMGQVTKIVDVQMGGISLFLQGAAGDIDPWCGLLPNAQHSGDEQIRRTGYGIAKEVLAVSGRIQIYESPSKISISSRFIDVWDIRNPQQHPAEGNQAEVNTVTIGDNIAFATFPGEFFTQFGLNLKRTSPFKNTLFIGYTNHALGYFPTEDFCQTGGYGTKYPQVLTACRTGEQLLSESLLMLREQKEIQSSISP